MYFDSISKFNVKESINEKYSIYAHEKEGRNEYLHEHIDLCGKYFFKIVTEKGIGEVFEKIENEFISNFSNAAKELFREMILNTIICHDMGKVNPIFQEERLGNDLGIAIDNTRNSHHSILSSIIYFDYYFEKIEKLGRMELSILLDFMLMNGYIISRHHGELNSIEEFMNKFKDKCDVEGVQLLSQERALYEGIYNKQIKIKHQNIHEFLKFQQKYAENLSNEKKIFRYIYERLLFSILVACDFYSTSEFMDGFEIDDIGNINDISEFYDLYKEGNIYKSIRDYEKKQYKKRSDFSEVRDINILRNELFLDAEDTLTKSIDSNIFYLEAPTGSGKSNVATNLSFKFLEEDKRKNKIFYVYPFNTLVEQNLKTFRKIFDKEKDVFNKIAVINSVFPIKGKDQDIINDNEDLNHEYYKKALLNRQFLNYPIVLTTHVTIFKYLFGAAKEDVFPLHQLVNSVIVLDEIQSYRNLIWGEIITFLNAYAKLLNIKIIIMSATLPDLNMLTESNEGTVRLISNRDKYFKNPIFKDRVKSDFELLKSQNILDDLYEHIKENSKKEKKILIEFINKNSAYNFYRRLKDDKDEIISDVQLMTGDDSPIERERILDLVSEKKDVLLVATQVIEAGVDIDMDLGYKDISMMDAEEQFLGRINRSCLKSDAIVFFFNLDTATNIYKNDKRMHKDLTLINEEMIKVLEGKDFGIFYKHVIDRLKAITSLENDFNMSNFFKEDVGGLKFKDVEKKMRLIEDDTHNVSIYLSSTLTKKDGEVLEGYEIWTTYRELLMDKDMDYAEKKVKLSKVRADMNNFIYKIKCEETFSYNDRIGDLYLIENGDKYFEDGKLNKEKFTKGVGELISI